MSYLSNILASIGGDSAPASASAPAPRAPPAAPKRKAEEPLTSGPAKRPTPPANAQNAVPRRPATPSNVRSGTTPKPRPAAPAAGSDYKGAARIPATGIVKKPGSKAQTAAFAPVAIAKSVPKPSAASTAPVKPGGDKPGPKKGSYAELMARAKAAQEAKQPVGVIKHKVTEKVNKKERTAEGAKGKNLPLRDKKAGDRSRTGSSEAIVRTGDKVKLKPIEKSEYKGTAKPTTPIYTGSGRPGQNAKKAARGNNDYADWSDLDDAEDEEGGYGSDESDMEAAAFDIDREEEEALRAAKKDDAAELALENRLKAEKLQRKQRLQQLVDQKTKKKPY